MSVRIGFIGSGGIARSHMSALEKIDAAEVIACMDLDGDRAAQAAARFAGAGAYTDLRKMLDEARPDAAYICVPPHSHGEIELGLIERGIPFFVEKPVGNDRQTPARVLEALEGNDLVTSAGYMMRYRDSARRALEYLAEDEPVVARGAWIGGMPGVHWWRVKAESGGQANEQTTHIFDLTRYLFGEVTSVFCAGRTGLITDVDDYSVEDATICTLTFESGLLCELTSSCAVGAGEVGLEVFARKGRLKMEGWDMGLTIQSGGETHSYKSTEDIFLCEDRVFIDALVSGDPSAIKSPYADAARTLMVTCAANESLETAAPVAP